MKTPTSSGPSPSEKDSVPSSVAVHFDNESLVLLTQAAPLCLKPEEPLVLWNALNASVSLTPAQQQLGSLMRGEV